MTPDRDLSRAELRPDVTIAQPQLLGVDAKVMPLVARCNH